MQPYRYADLPVSEEQLIASGKHVLVSYIMKPKAGYDYLATAAHYAAESSTGTNVNVATPMTTSPSPSMRWCTTSTGGQGVQVRLPEPARRCHRWPRDDVLGPDPDHRQQPGHG